MCTTLRLQDSIVINDNDHDPGRVAVRRITAIRMHRPASASQAPERPAFVRATEQW